MTAVHVYENSRELCRQLGAERYTAHLREALRSGKTSPRKVDLECEFDAILGPYWKRKLTESSDLLASDFPYALAVGREVVDAAIREAFEATPTPVHRLIPERTVTGPAIEGGWEHLVTSFSHHVSSVVEEYQEGVTQALAEFAIMRPKIKYRHRYVTLTKEMRLRDDLNTITDSAARIGEEMAYEAELDCLKLLLGIENTYQDSVNGAVDTFQASTPWVNRLSGNDLVDYTDLDAIRNLLAKMAHPVSKKPLGLQWRMKHLLVMPQRYTQARNIIMANEVTMVTDTETKEAKAGNPYLNQFEMFADSQIAFDLLTEDGVSESNAAKYALCGDFSLALKRAVAEPLTVAQSVGSIDRRIDVRWDATWAYAHYVVMPQAIIKSYQA